jgi:hypothetical protein
LVQLGAGDLVDPGPDGLHRAQCTADRPPHDARQSGGAQRHRQHQLTGEGRRAVLDVLEIARHPDRRAVDLPDEESHLPATIGQLHGGRAAPVGIPGQGSVQIRGGGQDGSVGADHLDEDVLVGEVALLHRPLGPHAERESVGVLVEELVQRLHQGPLVDQPEPDTGHRQHRQDGERRDGGDAEAKCSRHARKEPTGTASRHGRGMR